MGLFTRNRNKSVLAPEGVSATPQGIIYSAPFAFDGQGQLAHNAVDLRKGGHVSLLKGFEAGMTLTRWNTIKRELITFWEIFQSVKSYSQGSI